MPKSVTKQHNEEITMTTIRAGNMIRGEMYTDGYRTLVLSEVKNDNKHVVVCHPGQTDRGPWWSMRTDSFVVKVPHTITDTHCPVCEGPLTADESSRQCDNPECGWIGTYKS